MPLSLSSTDAARVAEVEMQLRMAAEMMGTALRDRLVSLAPALAPVGEDGSESEATLELLELDHEGSADPLSLAACIAAHRAYVTARGRPGAVSSGALALSRILIWAQRAAMLGRVPDIAWIGPAPRCPAATPSQATLRARATVRLGDARRRAEAAALITAPTVA